MIWEKDALDKGKEVARNSNCSEFIYFAAEFFANRNGHEKVQMSDLQTVLDFIEANREPDVATAGSPP